LRRLTIYRKLGVTSRSQLTGHLVSEQHRDVTSVLK